MNNYHMITYLGILRISYDRSAPTLARNTAKQCVYQTRV